MKNYICIDGKKAELTEEQLKALGIETPKASPFERNTCKDNYYFIESTGKICSTRDFGFSPDYFRYNTANYCTDKSIMEQRALHETLNRLLWRYSMMHDGDKIDWSDLGGNRFRIFYDYSKKRFLVGENYCQCVIGSPYFYTEEIAEQAIEEIVEPFMKENPEFKW